MLQSQHKPGNIALKPMPEILKGVGSMVNTLSISWTIKNLDKHEHSVLKVTSMQDDQHTNTSSCAESTMCHAEYTL